MAQTEPEATAAPAAPASTPPTPQQAYQPISGLAVTGLVFACLFAILVAISSAASIVQGIPFFLPEWLLGIPVAAIVLCFVAQQRIRNSEGTLAGLKPARWGLWLALLTALGYFAFSLFTGLAITQQADAFLRTPGLDSGFFARLQEGKNQPEQIDQAFLLTQKVSERPASVKNLERIFDRPGKDGQVGELSRFRGHFLVRTLVRNGAEARIDPMGNQQWSYENHGYKVQRHYRVTTAEAVFDLRTTAQSTEIPGSQRKWLVVYPPDMRVTLTPVGVGLKSAWASAVNTVQTAMDEVKDRSLAKLRDDTDWEKIVIGHPRWQELRDLVLERLTSGSSDGNTRGNIAREEHIGPWEVAKGRLRFHVSFSMQFIGPGRRPFAADGQVLVEGTKRIIQADHDLAELSTHPETQWRILAVQFRRAMPIQF